MFVDFKIKVFLVVAHEESFTRAAHALGITQPAVSQNIAELEKELGSKLFDRSPQFVSLTAEGTAFLHYAEKLQRLGDDAVRLFAPVPPGNRTRLTVMAPPLLQENWLPERLAPVLNVRKGLRVTLLDAPSASAESEERSDGERPEEADLRLRLRPHTDRLDFGSEGALYAGVITPLLLVSVRNMASLQAVSLEDLPEAPLAVWEGYADMLPDRLKARICLVSPSLEAVRHTVAQSPSALGLVPDTAAALPDTLRRISLAGLPPLLLDVRCSVSDAFSRTALWDLLKHTFQA